jgi:hypothetical protein
MIVSFMNAAQASPDDKEITSLSFRPKFAEFDRTKLSG